MLQENFHLPEEEQQHVFNAFSDSAARLQFTQQFSSYIHAIVIVMDFLGLFGVSFYEQFT